VRIPRPAQTDDEERVCEKAFTLGQVLRVLDAVRPEYRVLGEFLAETSLRVSEAIGLRWIDLDPGRGVVHVRRRRYKGREDAPKTRYGRRKVRPSAGWARPMGAQEGRGRCLRRGGATPPFPAAVGKVSSVTAAPFEPDVTRWNAWRPEEVARRFAGLDASWYVAAGWAIDLFLGVEWRAHEDLEVGVPRDRFDAFADALAGFELFVVGSGLAWPYERAGEARDHHHQTWARECATGLWRLDLFREPSDGSTWICRRDERIRLPYDELIDWTPDGIPFARPEVVLLFKAKHARPKDDADLAAVLPRLGAKRRRRLADALELVHPGHRWLEELGAAAS